MDFAAAILIGLCVIVWVGNLSYGIQALLDWLREKYVKEGRYKWFFHTLLKEHRPYPTDAYLFDDASHKGKKLDSAGTCMHCGKPIYKYKGEFRWKAVQLVNTVKEGKKK